MPLPLAGSVWPPRPFGPIFDTMAVNAAWFGNDIGALNERYSHGGQRTADAHYVDGIWRKGGLRGLRDRFFNGQAIDTAYNSAVTRIHSPLATNIATLSADLLTSDPGVVRVVNDDGDTVQGAVQDTLDLLMNSQESRLAFRRGCEWSAGIGAAAYSWAWAPGVNDGLPWLQPHAADCVIPTYTAGRLTSIAIVDTYPTTGDAVLRHIVSHDPGTITHGLFLGKSDALGTAVAFNSTQAKVFAPHLVDQLSGLQDSDSIVTIKTGTPALTAAYQINKPTILYRKDGLLTNMGRADIEGGAEGFLDAHDEAWSSLLRDMKVGRARLLVGPDALEGLGAGNGAYFDDAAELFQKLGGLGGNLDGNMGDMVSAQQFDIRVDEHLTIIKGFVGEVLQFAGYSQSSYGDSEGTTQTATDSVDRAKKSERTRDAKLTYLELAMRSLTRSGLDLSNNLPGVTGAGPYEVDQISVDFPEVSQIDPEKQARVIQYLMAAKALSTYSAVKELHPDWTTEEVGKEVDRITQAAQTVGTSPFDFGADTPPDLSSESSGLNDAGANDQAGTPAPAGS